MAASDKQNIREKKRIVINGVERDLFISPERFAKVMSKKGPLMAITNFTEKYRLSWSIGDSIFKEIELKDKRKIRVRVRHVFIESFIDNDFQGNDSQIFSRVGCSLHKKFYKLFMEQNVINDYNSAKTQECFVKNSEFKKNKNK